MLFGHSSVWNFPRLKLIAMCSSGIFPLYTEDVLTLSLSPCSGDFSRGPADEVDLES